MSEKGNIMTERDFEILKVISDLGNITKASNRLCITQSALSKRIKLLEDELGVALLERYRGGVVLTPKGRIVLNYGLSVSAELNEMRQMLKDPNLETPEELAVGISMAYVAKAAEIIKEYRTEHNNVKIDIITGDGMHIYEQLIRDEIDIALLYGDVPWTEYKASLSTEDMFLADIDKAGKHNGTYIRYSAEQGFYDAERTWVEENYPDALRTCIDVNNIYILQELLRDLKGWSVLPYSIIKVLGLSGLSERCINKDGTPLTCECYMYARENSLKKTYVKKFMEMVI